MKRKPHPNSINMQTVRKKKVVAKITIPQWVPEPGSRTKESSRKQFEVLRSKAWVSLLCFYLILGQLGKDGALRKL